MESTAEEDRTLEQLKCVGIMKNTKERFNYAKNVEFMSMQMYVFFLRI